MPGGWRKWSRGNWTAVSDDTEGLRAATEPVDPRLINTQDNGASSFSCAPLLPVISNDHRPTPSMTTEPYRAVPYRTVRTHARSHAQTHNLDRPLARSLAPSLPLSLTPFCNSCNTFTIMVQHPALTSATRLSSSDAYRNGSSLYVLHCLCISTELMHNIRCITVTTHGRLLSFKLYRTR